MALAILAPDGSVTTPLRVPPGVWAGKVPARRILKRKAAKLSRTLRTVQKLIRSPELQALLLELQSVRVWALPRRAPRLGSRARGWSRRCSSVKLQGWVQPRRGA